MQQIDKLQLDLVRLLRVSLTSRVDSSFSSFDSKALVHLAYHQEVATLVYDAIDGLYRSGQDIIEDKDAKLRLLKQALKQEQEYARNIQVIKKLSALFDSNGIVMYVLKGLSTAQYYPKPQLRYSCDMDCLLAAKCENGFESRFDEGNKLIESQGIKVTDDYYKHSEFRVSGLYVENHKFCCSIKRGKRTKALEIYLQSLLHAGPHKDDKSGLYFPPLMFQAIFLIEHANSHFLYEKINLKHICDWAMFRRANIDLLDWNEFRIQCERFGLLNFVLAMDSLADVIIGDKDYSDLDVWEKRIFDDSMQIVTYVESKMVRRFRKAFGILGASWKFRHFGHSSMLRELFTAFFAYLFEDNPKLTE